MNKLQTTPQNVVASTGKAGLRYRQEALEGFYDGFKAAGIDFAVFLPDSMLDGVEQLMIERGDIQTYQCSREDEGIAMAMGAFLVGRRPVALMEGSGIGLSALILARGIVQKTPTMLIVGHNSTLSERYDYHGATRLVAEPVLRALDIPYHVLFDSADIHKVVVEAQATIEGQRLPFGILVPSHVIRETEDSR
ncbi:MAG TPA: thiamine pyrophosphate-binding protein [Candidatus Binatia bacterium]|nr:thiamine pyrophosphate-binding protein [Candidatus Binatia bacterium]